MENETILEENQFEELIRGLIDNQFGCCNDFVKADIVNGLSTNLTILSASGSMKTSGIGNSKVHLTDSSIRGDTVNWIESKSTNPYEAIYLAKVWKFIGHLNSTCFTSVKSFESHYASYGQGSFYKRHLDQFKNEKGRKFSIVLYLNHDWKEEDGGKLSLYPAGKVQQDISPLGGRMVFFRSNEMEHEVLPSLTRDRRSIAGWMKD